MIVEFANPTMMVTPFGLIDDNCRFWLWEIFSLCVFFIITLVLWIFFMMNIIRQRFRCWLDVIMDSRNPVFGIEQFYLVNDWDVNDYLKWVFSALVIISLKEVMGDWITELFCWFVSSMENDCCIWCETFVEMNSRFVWLYSKTLFCRWLNLKIILFTKGDYGLCLLCIYLAMLSALVILFWNGY